MSQSEPDMRALELRRAGVPLFQIAQELGYADADAASAAVNGALDAIGVVLDPEQVRRLEMDRLDRMRQGLWSKARNGDTAAIEKVLRIQEQAVRLAGAPVSTVMVEAYDASVAALRTEASDGALIAAGRRIAERIDASAGGLDPLAETKAMFLVPHLMGVLRELGATPAARAAVKNAKGGESGGGKLGEIRSARRAGGSAEGSARVA